MRVYKNVIEAIEKACFECVVPERYQPNLGQYANDPTIEPIYQPEEYATSYMMATIVYIVDMMVNNIEFTIVREKDLLTIDCILEEYLRFINPAELTNDTARVFYERAKRTHAVLHPRADRVRVKNGLKPTNTLFDMLSASAK